MEAAPLPTPVNSIYLDDPEPPIGTPSPEADASPNPFITYHPGAHRDTNPIAKPVLDPNSDPDATIRKRDRADIVPLIEDSFSYLP